jgi:hypothetical protein
LRAALEQYEQAGQGVRVTTSAGVPQMAVEGDPRTLAAMALAHYYRMLSAGPAGDIQLGEGPATLTQTRLATLTRAGEPPVQLVLEGQR